MEFPDKIIRGDGKIQFEYIREDKVAPIKTISEMEKELILKAIIETKGNKTKASKILGVTTRTLRNKLHEYAEGGNQIND